MRAFYPDVSGKLADHLLCHFSLLDRARRKEIPTIKQGTREASAGCFPGTDETIIIRGDLFVQRMVS